MGWAYPTSVLKCKIGKKGREESVTDRTERRNGEEGGIFT